MGRFNFKSAFRSIRGSIGKSIDKVLGRRRGGGGDEIARLRKQITALLNTINNNNTRLSEENNTLTQLRERLNFLLMSQGGGGGKTQQQLDQEKINDLNQQIIRCNNNVASITNNLNSTTASLEQTVKKLGELQGRFDTLAGEKRMADATIALNQVTIAELNKTIVDLTKIIADLRANLAAEQIDNSKLRDQIKALNAKIVQLQQENYSNRVFNSINLLNLQRDLDLDLNKLFSYLKTQSINPDVIFEKINYRAIEHEKLHNINKILNIVYYCFFIAFIIIILSTGNQKIEHFLIYLFVGLIPILYPFLYKLMVYMFTSFFSTLNGPKNAFVDINNTIFRDGYNV